MKAIKLYQGAISGGNSRRALSVLLLAASLPAFAHHIVTDYGIARVEPTTHGRVEFQAAGFHLERSGKWQTLVFAGEYAPTPWLSLSGRLPTARIQYSDGLRVSGIADVEFGARFRLFATEHGGFILSAGLGLEMPTGNPDVGLGAGHFEWAPFITASGTPFPDLVIFAAVSSLLSLGDQRQDEEDSIDRMHGSVISPHNPREIIGRMGAAYILEPVFFSTGLDIVQPMGDRNYSRFISGRIEVGYKFGRGFRLLGGGELPITGDKRFDWKAKAELSWGL